MEVPVEIAGFEGRGLKLRTASFFAGPKLFVDGREVKGKRKRYMLRDNRGNQVEFLFRFNGLDPAPRSDVEECVLRRARPLRWYEYAWIALPVSIVFGGGALGVLCGLPAIYTSMRIFRTERASLLKYLFTGSISCASMLAYTGLVVLFNFLAGA
ncbi:MAG: hypothetical protein HYY46_19765 [Deltaproteobacteria bacterium]|nr:hypothetical protein [Deltaproteobacteria bacterium]